MTEELRYSMNKIQNSDLDIFCDMLSYVSPFIYDSKKDGEDVLIEIESNKKEEVLEKIKRLEEIISSDEMSKKREIKIKTLKDFTQNEPLHKENIMEKLLKDEIVVQISKGAYAYGGIFLKVFSYFNKKIDEFLEENFTDIRKYEVPVLYPIDEFEKGGYFESFPHHIMFQTTIKSDIDILDRFAKEGTAKGEIFENMKKVTNVLRHAACVPVYPMLENKVINSEKEVVFEVSGKCFRNEGNNIFELGRVNEFYMKEYAFVGTQDQVLQAIEKCRNLWYFWVDKFKLNGKIDTANDSFFASNYKKLKLFQMLGNSKQEFKLWLPDSDSYISASSSNVHRTHFTKERNIRNEHGYCQSSCFAFGLERLTYALLSQKGLDVKLWDDDTYEEIFGMKK